MTLWFALALMTIAAVFAVLWPLTRRGDGGEPAAGDVAVYRDQLEELERDKRSGLIGEAEAEAARIEVARRLLGADSVGNRGGPEQASGRNFRRRAVAALALVLIPAGAAGLYLKLGAPKVPGAPLAERQAAAPEHQSIVSLVAQVEKHLESNPQDGRGWEVLAPVYARMGRFADAVQARQNALRLLGSTPTRQADYGEALTLAANGIVTAQARSAFEKAVAENPKEPKAQYFLGLAASQDGKRDEAAAIWRKLLAEAPPDASWRDFVQEALVRIGEPAPSADKAGPSSEEVAAAALLTPEQRTEMMRGMVDRLASRLRENGSDLEGWERLLRSYKALGEAEKAKQAAAEARKALAADDEKLRQINALIRQLGLES